VKNKGNSVTRLQVVHSMTVYRLQQGILYFQNVIFMVDASIYAHKKGVVFHANSN
jgi:hypothetical protein